MTVHIHIEGASGAEVRKQIADLLGGPQMIVSSDIDMSDLEPGSIASRPVYVQSQVETEGDNPSQLADDLASAGIAHTLDVKPKRERGKPSPGHARRTKAEIAEDEAAEKAPTVATFKTLPDDSTPEQVADAFAGLKSAAEDTPDVQAADAADEAAETAANKPADAPPTVEDIRNVLGLYQKIYGIAACMEDGPAILQEVCGEGVVKVSSVPEDKIADVIAALKKAGNDNRFNREAIVQAA